MAVQGFGRWQCLVILLLASSSFFINDTFGMPLEATYEYYDKESLQEVMEIPSMNTTSVCVVSLKDTRLRVIHTDAEGRKLEVTIKKKLLTENTLSELEIEMQTIDDSKPPFSVTLDGKKLPDPKLKRNTGTTPQQPRTTLLLQGKARIGACPVAPAVRGGEKPHTEEKQTVTQQQEGKEATTVRQIQEGEDVITSRASSVPSFLSTDASFNSTSEEPEPDEQDPWWSFLLVLGKVGEVPVLALLLGGVLLGAVIGGIVVCFCSKACQKRRVRYEPVSTRRSQPLVTNDIIRETEFWKPRAERSSGFGSAFSTLTTDHGSRTGTAGRPSPSANNSIDRSTVSTNHFNVNNLGTGTKGSPSSSAGRGHNSITNNILNIPNGSMSRYESHKSTGPSDNKSTGSSLNRNTNRSPNIPYTKTLGTLTGHQDSSMIMTPISAHHDDFDSDDSNYDKPYVTSPILDENYSVPHATQIVTLERPQNSNTSGPSEPVDRQVPPFQYATFGK